MAPHVHRVQIYYEDTDLSGIVYHANYLKYFERAREHLLGPAELVRLWDEDGIGFVVYRCELKFKEGARLGDTIEIRTTVRADSAYRAVFEQNAWRPGGQRALVEGVVQLVCVNRDQELVKLPDVVLDQITRRLQ